VSDGDNRRIMDETESIRPVYDIETMRKYVAYSKRITPVMTDEALEKIRENYLEIRRTGGGEKKSVPITARQLEAFVRLSEASARMRLSRVVERSDARKAVDLVEYYLSKILAPEGGQWDIDKLSADYTKKDRNELSIILDILNRNGSSDGLSEEEIVGYAMSEGLSEEKTRRRLNAMKSDGTLYSPKNNYYKGA
jgi:replicative DNA helicase Mcm